MSADESFVAPRAALWLLQPGDPLGRVHNRLRVRHATNGSESSGSSGSRAGRDGLLVTLPGLAQMDMQVNEARSDDQTTRIEFLVRRTARFARRRDLSHLPIAQQNIHRGVQLRAGINKPPALDQQTVIFSSRQICNLTSLPRIHADCRGFFLSFSNT